MEGDEDVLGAGNYVPRNYIAENYAAGNYVAEVCRNLRLRRGGNMAQSMVAGRGPPPPVPTAASGRGSQPTSGAASGRGSPLQGAVPTWRYTYHVYLLSQVSLSSSYVIFFSAFIHAEIFFILPNYIIILESA